MLRMLIFTLIGVYIYTTVPGDTKNRFWPKICLLKSLG